MTATTDHPHSLARSAKNFFYGTFLSRISGLIRDMSLAFFFGSSPEIAAFMLAYRFANLFRRLFGEGTLQAGFIPHFETLRGEDSKKASLFFRDFFFSLLLILLGIILLGEVGLGISYSLSGAKDVLLYTMMMLPGLAFICLHALDHAHLQCNKNYFLGAVAPVGFNLVWIASVLLLKGKSVFFLCIGVILAFAMQWGLTFFKSTRFLFNNLSFKEWARPRLFSPELRKMLQPLTLGIVGVGAMQINSALDGIFARIADPSGPAYLWYAIRLQQVPLALFAIAISGALLPPLSRAVQEGDESRYRKFLNGALRYAFALMLPCTLALIMMGGASINLLYGRGSFSSTSVVEALYCLWGYSLALVPATFVFLFAAAYYATKEYWAPSLASVSSVLLNIILNAIFILGFHWGAASVALATSISSFFNAGILMILLMRKKRGVFEKQLVPSFLKTSFCGLCACLGTLWVGRWLHDPTWKLLGEKKAVFVRNPVEQLASFSLLTATFLGVLWISAYFTKAAAILKLAKRDKAKIG